MEADLPRMGSQLPSFHFSIFQFYLKQLGFNCLKKSLPLYSCLRSSHTALRATVLLRLATISFEAIRLQLLEEIVAIIFSPPLFAHRPAGDSAASARDDFI